jgi:hypothetical protein
VHCGKSPKTPNPGEMTPQVAATKDLAAIDDFEHRDHTLMDLAEIDG